MRVDTLIKILERIGPDKEVKLLDERFRNSMKAIRYLGINDKNVVLGNYEPTDTDLEKIGPF